MIVNLKKVLSFLIFIIFLWQLSLVKAQAAPRLFFEPSSGDYNLNQTFEVVVKIDTNDEEVVGADAYISFDQNRLKINQVTAGDFFPGFSYNAENNNGRLSIWSSFEQTMVTNSGVGDIATITFEAIGEGTANVSYICEPGSDTESSIWDEDYNCIIDCSAVGSGSYQIGEGEEAAGENDETTQEVETTADAPTPTPSTLPEAGFEAPLLIAGLGGLILLLLSSLLAL